VIVSSPTSSAVINALNALPSPTPPTLYLRLLALLQAATSSHELSTVDIPILGEDRKLYRRDEVFFNDLGDRRLDLLSDAFVCVDSNITAEFARALELKLLSESDHAGLTGDEDMEMHEELTDRICSALRQYTKSQIFLEFLANAFDAGASSMTVIIDEKISSNPLGSRSLFLSSSPFHTETALVFHNDAIFQRDDFVGIRSIGVGSKRPSGGKIGRFGIGALSAYHISEVCSVLSCCELLTLLQVLIIISGDQVLFLDPSRQHFINRRRNDRLLSLKVVQRSVVS
jgi:sacsin